MKSYFLITILLLLSYLSDAQLSDSILTKSEFRSEFSRLAVKIKTLEKANSQLQILNSYQKREIDSIATQLSASQSNIQQIADSLHINITNISATNIRTQGQIQNINQAIINRTTFWVIGISFAFLLSILIYFSLRRKLSSNTQSLGMQIDKINSAIQSEALKLDSKLVEVLQTQLTILKGKRAENSPIESPSDHKLPLKVGEEIHRMRKRIANMPQDIKGLSALTNSLQRLEEEFNDNGYEIEELIGKKYIDGMKVEARFVDNPGIPKGEEIITDVLRPQIMYNGTIIQVAKVEVGKSY